MQPTKLIVEVLLRDKPYKVVEVPVVVGREGITKRDIKSAENRAFWAIIAQRQYEPEEIKVRYAPELRDRLDNSTGGEG